MVHNPEPRSAKSIKQDPTPLDENAPWPSPLFTTQRLVVRSYHPSDAAEIARLANNKKISQNMTNRFPSPYTISNAKEFISLALNSKTTGCYAYVISLSKEGPPIGGCGLEPGSDIHIRNAEVGYWLGEEYWSRGYVSEVCAGLVDYAFSLEKGIKGNSEPLLRLGAGVFSGNLASGKVLMKNGFRHEGTLKGIIWKWGERKDLEVYGLLREEWEQARSQKKE